MSTQFLCFTRPLQFFLSRGLFPVIFFTFLVLLLVQCNDKQEVIPAVEITSIFPTTGQPGTLVRIRGRHFGKRASENVVVFNGVNAEVVSASDTLLEVKAPANSKSGIIEVTTRNETKPGPGFKYYNLYCFGGNYYYAGYWKDGVPVKLSSMGYIYDLAILGEEVHAVGLNFQNSVVPQYWKNGQPSALEGLNDRTILTRIVASGQDVYVCGNERLSVAPYFVARCWKNGKLMFADASEFVGAKVLDMAVSGSDVYLVGSVYPKAMLWKNGVPTALSDGTTACEAERVRIVGSDVHVVGNQFLDPSLFGNAVSILYWKNGALTTIKENFAGRASDFIVSKSEIIIVGNKGPTATYWINGVEKSFPGNANRFGAAVEVTDDATYFLVNEWGQGFYPYSSALLRNMTSITPDYGPGVTGSINGMFVQYY